MFLWKNSYLTDTSYAEYKDTLSVEKKSLFRFNQGQAFWLVTAKKRPLTWEAVIHLRPISRSTRF